MFHREITAALIAALLGLSVPALGAIAAPAGQQQTDEAAATVLVNGKATLTLGPAGGQTPQERAQAFKSALSGALTQAPRGNQPAPGPGDVHVKTVNGLPVLMLGDASLATVTGADAKLAGKSRSDTAQQWARELKASLKGVTLGKGQSAEGLIAIAPGTAAVRTGSQPTSASQPAASNTMGFATISIQGKQAMRVADAGDLTAEKRAETVRTRLHDVMESKGGKTVGPIKPSDVTVQSSNSQPVIRLKNSNIVTVTGADAQLADKSPQQLAEQWANRLRDSLADIKVTPQENLPKDFVTIATGQITRPSGGGAGKGGTPRPSASPSKR